MYSVQVLTPIPLSPIFDFSVRQCEGSTNPRSLRRPLLGFSLHLYHLLEPEYSILFFTSPFLTVSLDQVAAGDEIRAHVPVGGRSLVLS